MSKTDSLSVSMLRSLDNFSDIPDSLNTLLEDVSVDDTNVEDEDNPETVREESPSDEPVHLHEQVSKTTSNVNARKDRGSRIDNTPKHIRKQHCAAINIQEPTFKTEEVTSTPANTENKRGKRQRKVAGERSSGSLMPDESKNQVEDTSCEDSLWDFFLSICEQESVHPRSLSEGYAKHVAIDSDILNTLVRHPVDGHNVTILVNSAVRFFLKVYKKQIMPYIPPEKDGANQYEY